MTSASASSMSKKDKMDFRVAKKRKAKAHKDMEMAGIIQLKNWSVDAQYARRRPKKQNMGGISDAFGNGLGSSWIIFGDIVFSVYQL